jgi:hypothetical protein
MYFSDGHQSVVCSYFLHTNSHFVQKKKFLFIFLFWISSADPSCIQSTSFVQTAGLVAGSADIGSGVPITHRNVIEYTQTVEEIEGEFNMVQYEIHSSQKYDVVS